MRDASVGTAGGSACVGGAVEPFQCNLCLRLSRDPVVARCGHCYCWRCLYRWLRTEVPQGYFPGCPTCKADIRIDELVPIYGRGVEGAAACPRDGPAKSEEQRTPPRPPARCLVGKAGGGDAPCLMGPGVAGGASRQLQWGSQPPPVEELPMHGAFMSKLVLLLGSFLLLFLLVY